MDYKDILILEFLSKQTEPFRMTKENLPVEIRTEFQFMGLDTVSNPDSMQVRLFQLGLKGFVKQKYAGMWIITDDGRYKLAKEKGQDDDFLNLSTKPSTQSVITTPKTKDKKAILYTSPIFTFIVWPIVAAVIAGAILKALGLI